jgi:hypothetical protein
MTRGGDDATLCEFARTRLCDPGGGSNPSPF